MKIAVTRRIPATAIELLKKDYEIAQWDYLEPPSRADVEKLIENADAALVMLSDRIDAELLDNAPRLKIVANMAVGFENVDLAAATSRGVQITNTPDVVTDATAEIAMALVLGVMRRIVESDAHMRAGKFKFWDPLTLRGSQLTGKKLGIIGFGRIGKATARRALAFGMEILCHSPSITNWDDPVLPAKAVSMAELLAESDVVSLHCPYRPEMHQMINAANFARMKKGAFFINTARGALVDEKALLQTLQSGHLAGAGLDVYEKEPAFELGLAKMQNVVMLPHIGSATIETRDNMAELAARNIVEFLAGNGPITPVNRLRN